MAPKAIGIFCPLCDQQAQRGGTQIDSMMLRDTIGGVNGEMVVKCHLQGHKIPYDRLLAMNPRKQKLIVNEKQPQGTSTMAVWIHPEALQRLRERFPSNLMTTMCSLMTALADGDTTIIEGEYVREITQLGISVTKGRDFAGMAQELVSLRRTVEELQAKVRSRQPKAKPAVDDATALLIKQMAEKLGMTVPQPAVEPAEPPTDGPTMDFEPFDGEFEDEAAQALDRSATDAFHLPFDITRRNA